MLCPLGGQDREPLVGRSVKRNLKSCHYFFTVFEFSWLVTCVIILNGAEPSRTPHEAGCPPPNATYDLWPGPHSHNHQESRRHRNTGLG